MKHTKKLLGLFVIMSIWSCSSNFEIDVDNYGLAIFQIGLFESSNPTKFLSADGHYSENFWGDEFELDVEISNEAYCTSYKDFEIEVIFYSETKSEIERANYFIYKSLSSRSKNTFTIDVKRPSAAKTVGWNIVSAKTI